MRRSITIRLAMIGIALGAASGAGAQAAKTAIRSSPNATPNGIVITGDREGPLGLHVAPWQEPAAILPDAMLQTSLPKVFDDPRSLAEDSVNRQFPAVESEKTPPASDKKDSRTSRRGKPKDDVPTVVIMPSRPQ